MDVVPIQVEELARRLQDLRGSDLRGGRSRKTELYFGAAKPRAEEPLIILHHIRKTAGTSLRTVMRSNYTDAQYLFVPNLGYCDRAVDPERRSRARFMIAYRKLWERLAADERRSLRCVASHEANFLRPFVDRSTKIVSLIREPVDRVLSAYYFKHRKARHEAQQLEEFYQEVAQDREIEKSKSLLFFNGQARSLLEPFYDTNPLRLTAGPSDDADLWRERLFSLVDKEYLLGVSEHFDAFVAFLSGEFGWEQCSSPRKKINIERPPRNKHSLDLVHTIAEYNWLDYELYERQLARLRQTQ